MEDQVLFIYKPLGRWDLHILQSGHISLLVSIKTDKKQVAKQIGFPTKTNVQVIPQQKSFAVANELTAFNSSNKEWVHIRNQS